LTLLNQAEYDFLWPAQERGARHGAPDQGVTTATDPHRSRLSGDSAMTIRTLTMLAAALTLAVVLQTGSADAAEPLKVTPAVQTVTADQAEASVKLVGWRHRHYHGFYGGWGGGWYGGSYWGGPHYGYTGVGAYYGYPIGYGSVYYSSFYRPYSYYGYYSAYRPSYLGVYGAYYSPYEVGYTPAVYAPAVYAPTVYSAGYYGAYPAYYGGYYGPSAVYYGGPGCYW
jgi:hypothetical protein